MKDFHSLSQREVLALAISLEEEDERVYADFAEGLRHDFPASATIFDGMRAEEAGHRRRLIELYRAMFGDHIPTHPPAGRAQWGRVSRRIGRVIGRRHQHGICRGAIR